MSRFITKGEIRRLGARYSLNEGLAVRKSASSRSSKGSVFLSHSSKDSDLVLGSIAFLQQYGAVVYIDQHDPGMPVQTSEKTAELLKERIADCSKFVILATPNSKDSRWVPWELGYADGIKGLDKIAILPESDEQGNDSWGDWEYLGIYNKIMLGRFEGQNTDEWMVTRSQINTAIRLNKWLWS